MISSTNLDQVPPEQFRAMAERGMQLLFLVDATGKKNHRLKRVLNRDAFPKELTNKKRFMSERAQRKSNSHKLNEIPEAVILQLGKRSDRDLSVECGISAYFLKQKRLALGIDQFKRGVYPEEMVQLLGKVTDREVGEQFGYHIATVCALRKKMGIASTVKPATTPTQTPNAKKREIVKLPQELVSQLGVRSDQDLSTEFGFTLHYLKKERKARGISSVNVPKYPEEMLSLLGKVADRDLVARFGYSSTTLSILRKKLGIKRHHKVWTAERIALLGKIKDSEVAALLGGAFTKGSVGQCRRSLGIPICRGPRNGAPTALFLSLSRGLTSGKMEALPSAQPGETGQLTVGCK